MRKDKLNTCFNGLIAFSGIIGVGSAIAYYIISIIEDPFAILAVAELIYILLTAFVFGGIYYSTKNGSI